MMAHVNSMKKLHKLQALSRGKKARNRYKGWRDAATVTVTRALESDWDDKLRIISEPLEP